MSKFSKQGSLYKVALDQDAVLLDLLPPAIYTIAFDPMQGYFLKHLSNNFEVPTKMYGTATETSVRVINTFNDRTASTGISLTGNQGSGKTLIAKDISNRLLKKNIPVVVVTSAYYGDLFIDFINSIEQEIVILFEEFEKVYKSEEQEALLTLFDGVFQNKKLFILTSNYSHRIIDQLDNRPGRIYYNFHFSGLDSATISDYCTERLNNADRAKDVQIIANMYGDKFNFDMMKAIVEELNRYPEDSISKVLEVLNIDDNDSQKYTLTKYNLVDSNTILDVHDDTTFRSVLNEPFGLGYKVYDEDPDDIIEWKDVRLNPNNITDYNKQTHAVTFMDKKGNTFELTPAVPMSRGSMFSHAF